MSAADGDFAPRPLVGNSFSVLRITLNQAQAQFELAIEPFNIAAVRFDDVESTWSAHPPTSKSALATLRPFLKAVKAGNRVLAGRAWEHVTEANVHALIRAENRDAAALTALAQAEPDPSQGDITTLARARAVLRRAGHRVHAELHLPG
jgi:hypothetical protein